MPDAARRSLAFHLIVLLALGRASVAVAQQPLIPTPESVFGFRVGADSQLFGYDQSINYFKRLAAASRRIKLINVGRTSSGHMWTAALISSPENLANLQQIRRINMRLSHPDGLTDAEALRLARTGTPIVDISGGLHASEIAGSQHTPQLAYEILAHANDPGMKEILDHVVLFLWPSINPDGQDIVVNWCRARYTGKDPGPMELYQKYVGHDNNRDSYMLNMIESRVIARMWREWEPDIIYVHHQSSPFPTRIWIPPFADPVGYRAPAIMGREVNAIGTRIAEELDAKGQPGAVHMLATYDAWYPGYIDYMPMYQNIPSWWTETQGGNCATPRITTRDSLPKEYSDLRPEPLYLSPWAEGKWGLRDAVDYMVTASIATLRYAAKFGEEVLYNRYLSGRNTIRQYRTSAPYAYVIPRAQHDPVAPVELLRRMAFLGVRVTQLDRPMSFGNETYPSGTWIIPMDQEFAQLVRELFEPQKYPDLGDDLPYDAAGWTLPYQMNVAVVEAQSPLTPEQRTAMKPVSGTAVDWHTNPDEPFTTNATAAGIVPDAGVVTASGDALSLDPAQTNAFKLINRALASGATLRFEPATSGRAPRWLVSGLDSARADAWAKAFWVRAERTTLAAPALASSSSGSAPLSAPTRVALYKSQPGVMDEGWTEWLLDQYGFKYTLITPADVRAGNLASRFDVILLASQSLTSSRGGRGGGGAPGGGGAEGRGEARSASADSIARDDSVRVRAADDFVRGGGTIVVWNQGTTSAINALKLPVKNVVAGVPRKDYFTGGSIMRAQIDVAHPVMAGMPAEADVFVNGSPVFTTLEGFDGSVLAKYPMEGALLRSGFLNGEKLMRGYAAALDVKHDRGHVVLLAFQPQWRGQPYGTFRVVFNSIFYGADVASHSVGTSGFWVAPKN